MPTPEYEQFQTIMRRGAFGAAADFAERQALAGNDRNEFWLTQQSRAYLRGRHYKKALECARQALSRAPDNRYALQARADALAAMGSHAEALSDYTELLNDAKLTQRARQGILECLAGTSQWPAVLSHIAQWGLPPQDALPWQVKALSALNQRDQAIEACHELLRLQPENPRVLWQLTELEVERNGLEAVLNQMGRLAKIPNGPAIYGEIFASLNRRAGNPEAALKAYAKLASGQSNPRIMSKQAYALAKSGGERTAIPMFEELLRLDPCDMYVHKAYVAACTRIGELEHVWKFYQELLTLFPDEKTLLGRLRNVQKQLEKK
jgi:tetratricopeptide (TPR) repeat protein